MQLMKDDEQITWENFLDFFKDISSAECYNVLSPFLELFKCHIPLEPG